jgi:hypothetical protein
MQKSGGCVQRCGCVKSSPPSDPGRSAPAELLKLTEQFREHRETDAVRDRQTVFPGRIRADALAIPGSLVVWWVPWMRRPWLDFAS